LCERRYNIMLTIISVLLACILILVGVLLACSPENLNPFLDENGSRWRAAISEKVFVNINGVEQGMFIKAKMQRIQCCFTCMGVCLITSLPRISYSLEDYFTVVWWEQRGSGISYSADIPQRR